MNIVCKKCERVLKDNQWIHDVIPIHQVVYTLCPQCQPKENSGGKPNHRMAYQQYIHKKDSDS